MQEIIKRGPDVRRAASSPTSEAREELADEPYKLRADRAQGRRRGRAADGADAEVGGGELTIYDNLDRRRRAASGSDLCRGPHLPTTRIHPAPSS